MTCFFLFRQWKSKVLLPVEVVGGAASMGIPQEGAGEGGYDCDSFEMRSMLVDELVLLELLVQSMQPAEGNKP